MDPEILLSGIREMIAAGVRLQVATDHDEKRTAGELYTLNEGVVRESLKMLFGMVESHDISLYPGKYTSKG